MEKEFYRNWVDNKRRQIAAGKENNRDIFDVFLFSFRVRNHKRNDDIDGDDDSNCCCCCCSVCWSTQPAYSNQSHSWTGEPIICWRRTLSPSLSLIVVGCGFHPVLSDSFFALSECKKKMSVDLKQRLDVLQSSDGFTLKCTLPKDFYFLLFLLSVFCFEVHNFYRYHLNNNFHEKELLIHI